MGAIYYKQPNGRFCRYSTICDAVTDYNMSEYDIIKLFVENAIDDAKKFINNERNFHDFDELCDKFKDGNNWTGEMSVKEFEKLKEKMSKPSSFSTIWERT